MNYVSKSPPLESKLPVGQVSEGDQGKGKRRAREAQEDLTRKDRALILTFLPPFLFPATQARKQELP